MSVDMEPVYLALFNLAKTSTQATTSGRVLKTIEAVDPADLPCLFQHQVSEDHSTNKGQPTIIRAHVDLYLYAAISGDIQSNASATPPAQTLNAMLTALRTALAPDPVTNTQTLGGLCSHAWIGGRVEFFEDVLSQRAAAVVPVEMLVTDTSYGQFTFDSGELYIKDSATGTPIRFGSVQSIQVDELFTLVRDPSTYQVAARMLRTQVQLNFKASFARINGAALAQAVWGTAVTSGHLGVVQVTPTIPATGPYTITPTPPSSGTYGDDLGVYDVTGANKGMPLTRVAGAPAAGQYAMSAGVYTFAAADKGLQVNIAYSYNVAAGVKLQLNNAQQNLSPTFSAFLVGSDAQGRQMVYQLNTCVSKDLGMMLRLEDYALPEFTFSALGGTSNVIGSLSFSQ